MKVRKQRIKSFILQSGERYCLLVDSASGMPLYYPNLFVTTQIRNNSLSLAAMETTLTALNLLLSFCDEHGIDLETRFLKRKFLTLYEVDGIRDHCQKRLAEPRLDSQLGSVRQFSRRNHKLRQTAALSTEYVRLTYIAKYSKWLAENLLSDAVDRSTALDIAKMQKQLESRRPNSKGRNRLKDVKGLDDGQLEVLFEVIRPGSEFNPFETAAIQIRNRLAILILVYLGIRGGELLNIRVSDINWPNNQIVIARRPDEKDDPRLDQPLVKTLDRRLPMKDTLAAEIHSYIKEHRRKLPNARRHDYLLVTHKSGPTQGQAMSIAAYQKMIRSIAGAAPELADLHGHALRHTWNRRFSELLDNMDYPPSPEEQEKRRSNLQGWREGSGTAATYNRRFTERKALEEGLKLQQGMTRIPEKLKNDE